MTIYEQVLDQAQRIREKADEERVAEMLARIRRYQTFPVHAPLLRATRPVR